MVGFGSKVTIRCSIRVSLRVAIHIHTVEEFNAWGSGSIGLTIAFRGLGFRV